MWIAKCELGLLHRFEIDFPNFHVACAFRFKDDPFAVVEVSARKNDGVGIGHDDFLLIRCGDGNVRGF